MQAAFATRALMSLQALLRTPALPSALAYSACSATLLLLNKSAVGGLHMPSLVMLFQITFACLVIMLACVMLGKAEELGKAFMWENVKPMLVYIGMFSLTLFSSARALEVSNVETIIVFRCCCPLAVSLMDAAFLGRELPSLKSFVALALIIGGAAGYVLTDHEFAVNGISAYSWVLIYLLVITAEMTYGKYLTRDVNMSLTSRVLLTNSLSIAPMMGFATADGELGRALTGGVSLSALAACIVFASAVVGTGISYSGWWCRSQLSATMFTVVGVMNKMLTELANVTLWDKHASPPGIASLVVCMVGGALYRQAPLRKGSSAWKASEAEKEAAKAAESPAGDSGELIDAERADNAGAVEEEEAGLELTMTTKRAQTALDAEDVSLLRSPGPDSPAAVI